MKRLPPTRKFAIEFRDDKIRRCYFHVVLLERRGNGPWKEVLRGAKKEFYYWVWYNDYFVTFYGDMDWKGRHIISSDDYSGYADDVQCTNYPTWNDLPSFQFKHEKDSPIEWQRVGAYSADSWDKLMKQARSYWHNRCLLNKGTKQWIN